MSKNDVNDKNYKAEMQLYFCQFCHFFNFCQLKRDVLYVHRFALLDGGQFFSRRWLV